MKEFHILTHEGEILRVVERNLVAIEGVLCMRAYAQNGTVINVAESRIVYGHEDSQVLEAMRTGKVKVKDVASWWLGFVAVCSELGPYKEYRSRVAKICDELIAFEKQLPHIDERTMEDGANAAGYMQRIWATLPDDPSIRKLPRWFLLCDLCSESWVFEFEEDEDD